MPAVIEVLRRRLDRLVAAQQQLTAMRQALPGLKTAAIPLWNPLPGPQTIAYQTLADVTGYGGAAGGGKTDLALGLALLSHKRSLILRRELVNTKTMMDRLREVVGNVGRFNSSAGFWYNSATGQKIEFGGCPNPGDEQKYRGRPHDLLVFDEADQFPQHVVTFISGWLRTTILNQRCRMLLCFNPPSTAEGEWLLSYFGPWVDDTHPRPAKPGEIRWYAMVDGKEVEREDGQEFIHKGETIRPKSRTFIPARLLDNPYLMATGYGATLQALPEPLRSQLLYGDFSIGRQDDAWQVIPTAWVKAAQKRWTENPPEGQPCICEGLDVAHGGADSTVKMRRHGPWFSMPQKFQGPITDTGAKAAYLVLKDRPENADWPVHVDAIGYGASCHECLEEKIGKKAVAINVAQATEEFDATGKFRLTNIRTAMHWKLREALDPEHGDNLMLPPDPELLSDLCAPRFEVRASGIVVESKEDIKERIGRSPDVGDACCLAFYRPRRYRADVYLG
jgi:hypothetical protein